jgi:hypothetical protein
MSPLRNVRIPSRLLLVLAIVFVCLPWAIIQFSPDDAGDAYVFEARLQRELGRSANGQLRYWQAEVQGGCAPGTAIVLAFDRSYTRGVDATRATDGATAWFAGGVMTPEVFYGEQYLFYGLPQVYVRQVKTGLLWPDQWTELRILYLSPLETLAAPVQALFIVRAEEFTIRTFMVLLTRCTLIAGAAWAIVAGRLRRRRLAAVLLIYAILAILLTIPILGDLY